MSDYIWFFDAFSNIFKFKSEISDKQKEYIRYFFSSKCFLDYINLVKDGGGTSAAKFNLEDVRNSAFTFPNTKELETIVNYLDLKCDQIDNLICKRQQKIEKLQEYKKSLIYEYVTGKKEV